MIVSITLVAPSSIMKLKAKVHSLLTYVEQVVQERSSLSVVARPIISVGEEDIFEPTKPANGMYRLSDGPICNILAARQKGGAMKFALVFSLVLALGIVGPAVAEGSIQADSTFVENNLPIYVNGQKLLPLNGGHMLSIDKTRGLVIDGVTCIAYKEEEVIQWGETVLANNFGPLRQRYENVRLWLKKGHLVLVGAVYVEVIAPEDAVQAQKDLAQIKTRAQQMGVCGDEVVWQPYQVAGKYKLVPSAVRDLIAGQK